MLNSQYTLNPEKIYDVLIIGAGPIGLATAIGLYKRGIKNILVIDQTHAFRQVGRVLDLLPNGLKSLKCLDINAYQNVVETQLSNHRNSSQTSSTWDIRNFQGEVTRSISLSFDQWFQEYGEGRVSIPWYELQTILRNTLPPDIVKANHRCINIVDEPENNCVRIDCTSNTAIAANPYAHWEENQNSHQDSQQKLDSISPTLVKTSFRAKLIIGADGINSTVRQIIYQNTPHATFSKPEYSGYSAIYCQGISDIPEEIKTAIETNFLKNSHIVSICNNQPSANSENEYTITAILSYRNEQFGYSIHLPLPLNLVQGKRGNDLINIAQQEIKKAGFPDCIQQFVNLSPPDKMEVLHHYIHHAVNKLNDTNIQPTWYKQRVVLIGDAAHGMPPFMAQGANQGLEDAFIITNFITKIAKNNDWDNLPIITEYFAKYEDLRREFMEYVQLITLTGFSNLSYPQWQDYNQKVYARNFADF